MAMPSGWCSLTSLSSIRVNPYTELVIWPDCVARSGGSAKKAIGEAVTVEQGERWHRVRR